MGRCGHLGHKDKICLLPAVQKNVEPLSVNEVLNEDRGVKPNKEQLGKEVIQVEDSKANLVLVSTDQISEPTNGTEIEQLQSQKGVLSTPVKLSVHSMVTIANGSNSQSTTPPFAGTPPSPAEPTIMEKISSHIIVSETNLESGDNSLTFMYTPTHGSPFHNDIEQFSVHDVGDGMMSDAMTNLSMSKMDWIGPGYEGKTNIVEVIQVVGTTLPSAWSFLILFY
ncbi:hypothetical protein F2Q68_00007982 [Brassica cretica]|uniref:Uncharacterized protein n=1 Tax=Brassica cretica TaxID=69181 RepID=A0A8S9KZH1_BRACR|nr:hypothetical protein F2Q68_00007982 [Brassica cretica]